MPRSATVWWNKQKGAWCTDIGGSRHVVSNKYIAWDYLRELLDVPRLLRKPRFKNWSKH